MSKYLKNSSYIFILLIFLSGIPSAQSPDLIFQNISFTDGLPSNGIFAIYQDHLGFLWFGTENGLVQYNGYQFKTYKPDKNDRNSICGCKVIQITEDNQGNLWILTEQESGINRFDRKTGKFIRFVHDPMDSTSLSYKHIFQFYLDSFGDLWAITYDTKLDSSGDRLVVTYPCKLDKINTTTGEITQYNKFSNEGTSFNCYPVFFGWSGFIRYSALYKDNNGIIWIGTRGGGLNRYDRDTDSFSAYKYNPSDPFSISCDTVSCIFEDSQGNMWIGTMRGGLNHFSRETETFTHYRHQDNDSRSIGSDFCYKIMEDSSNNLWIALGNGLDCFDIKNEIFINHYRHNPGDPNSMDRGNRFLPIFKEEAGFIWILVQGNPNQLHRYDTKTGHFFHYQEDYNNPKSILGFRFISFFEDHSGVHWIGTSTRGITKYNPLIQSFRHYKHEPGDTNSISHNFVYDIIESKSHPGIFWIGTQDGLNKYDQQTNTFTHYKHDPNNANSLSTNYIVSLLEDNEGLLWISTIGGGLNCYDAKSRTFKHYDCSPEYSKKPRISALYEDRSGIIWMREGGRGLLRLDKNSETFSRYLPNPHDKHDPSNNLHCICEDDDGYLWICTDGGLKKFNTTDKTFTASLLENEIYQMYVDSKNNLWIATTMNGLVLFDRETKNATFYKQDHGLANNELDIIVEDDNGILWLGTRSGLSRFNPQTKEFTNFYTQHGLPSNDFCMHGIKASDGKIWMNVERGIVTFNPDDIEINKIPPKVVITDIKLFNKSLSIDQDSPLRQDISVTKKIHLAHWQNDISLECTALHFSYPEKNQYKFWLENYDRDWYYAGTNRMATYTNLDPGEYIFHAKGSNSDGVWNEQGVSLRIVIDSPWWATAWAYGLYFLIIGLIVYGSYQFQLKRARMKHELSLEKEHAEKLEEINQMKSQFFANISHEFRTPLTLIIGPLKNLLSKTRKESLKTQYRIMIRNAQQLLRLINQLLDFSKLEAEGMSLQAKNQDIISILKGIVLSFKSLAERQHIRLSFHAEQNTIFAYIDRDKIEKIITNLLSNAFKFTPEGGRIDVLVNLIENEERAGEGDSAGEGEMGREGEREHRLERSHSPTHPFPHSHDGRWVEISITDTGIGIPAEHLEHIFNRYYQVNDNSHQAGTGIGLALARELVELHHGEITARSEPGQGTTFTIHLPSGKDHLEENEIVDETKPDDTSDESHLQYQEIFEDTIEPPEDLEPSRGSETKHLPIILIVEDNNDVRAYVRDSLGAGYYVKEAIDGTDGFEKAIETIPDLIISDVMMPGMDGFELCHRLKTDERTSHVPVILLTARASGEDKLAGLETGADDYLVKPFDTKELQVRVKNLIQQRRKLRERFSREITLQPQDITVTSTDERFLQRAMNVIEQNLDNPDFDLKAFTRQVGMSRANLHRKLRALVNQSPSEFIRTMRLKRAASLLEQRYGNVAEIAYEVGFNNPAYFAECFRKQFGKLPSEYH